MARDFGGFLFTGRVVFQDICVAAVHRESGITGLTLA
jgi:hypothetical protein